MAADQKINVFLWLTVKNAAREKSVSPKSAADNFLPDANPDAVGAEKPDDEFSIEIPAWAIEQLTTSEADKLRQSFAKFQKKSFAEQENWRAAIKARIGQDVDLIDAHIHRSHIESALARENAAMRKAIERIIGKTTVARFSAEKAENVSPLEKVVWQNFLRQFIQIRDLTEIKVFDNLNGVQLARLIRWAGVEEVARACARIEAVETVAAFLRRFSTEDARIIAAQLNNLPATPVERIEFAENLVQTALDAEPNTAAMLDWLGLWLIGTMLCRSDERRIAYTQQKFPFEFSTQLTELIEAKCRETPESMQTRIAAEIEQLATVIIETTA